MSHLKSTNSPSRGKNRHRLLGRSLALPGLFLFIGGPTGGGGGGGSSSGGSSSNSYSSSSSSSYYRSDRNDGESEISLEGILLCGAVVGVVALSLYAKDRILAVARARRPEYRVGSWVFLLRNGEDYSRVFAQIRLEHSFSTPERRRSMLMAVAMAIQSGDVTAMSYRVSDLGPAQRMADHSRELFKGLSVAGAMKIRSDLPQNVDLAEDSVCLVCLVASAKCLVEVPGDANPDEVLSILRSSNEGHHGVDSFLYFSYEPASGTYLSPDEGRERFERMATRK